MLQPGIWLTAGLLYLIGSIYGMFGWTAGMRGLGFYSVSAACCSVMLRTRCARLQRRSRWPRSSMWRSNLHM